MAEDPISFSLKPFRHLYLFSTTASSLGSKDLLASSTWYRMYLVTFTAASTLLLLFVVGKQETIKISPFNITSLYIYYWIVQFSILISPLIDAKKMRVQKILRALRDLDLKMKFRQSRDVEKYKRIMIAAIVSAMVYHIMVHILVVTFFIASRVDSQIVILSFWFKVLEFAIDVEILCLGSLVLLLGHRCEYFVSHLNDILDKRVPDTGLNLLLCHRQLHYVLKKINKAFKTKITVTVYFVTTLSLRNLILLLSRYEEKYLVFSAIMLVCRYLMLLGLLGAIGQRVANTFDKIHLAVTDLQFSTQINSELCRRGAHMCAEGVLRVRRLCGSGLVVDARLPLRVLAAIGSILVFIFSIKIDMKAL